MTSRGLRRSRSRSADSGKSGSHKSHDRPWLRSNRSNSRSRSRSTSRSRSSRGRRTSKDGSRSSSPTRPVMSKDPKYMNARVFVANLASDITTTGELTKLFEKHGRILDTLVHHNGYGFVQFAREEEGRAAVASVNGTLFHGKKIKCNMAAEKRNKSTAGNDGPSTVGDNRFNRDRSPNREPFGGGFSDPFFGGRDLPPPPRDPYFDDPYRRPVPPDPFFDRFRDDPYRRDPYAMDLYRDPYRDPYPPPPPVYDTLGVRKPVHVDCEIIVLNMVLRDYAEMIEHRLKNLNILTSVVVIREDRTIQQQVEDATRRGCLFAVVINSQNEVHRSLTLNILHGLPQEHRNMPLDDALALVARSFDKYLQTEKEKAAAALSSSAKLPSVPFLPPAKEIAYLLNLLADNRQLTIDELNKVIVYLKERRDKLMEAEGIPTQNDQKVQESTSSQPPEQLLQQQQISQQQLLQHQQLQQQQQMSQQQQQMSQQQLQQQQQQQQMSQQQLQQQQQHQELQSKILSLMNGTSTSVPTTLTVPKPVTGNLGDTLLTLTKSTSLKPLTQTVSPVLPQAASLSMYPPQLVEAAAPASAPAPSSAPALINFDNPTVQKALENLIQSGPNLLRNITIPKTVTQPAAPGSTGLFPSTSTHRPY